MRRIDRVQRDDLRRIMRVQGTFFQDWLLQPTVYNGRLLASLGGKTPVLLATAEDGQHEVKRCEALLKSRPSESWVMV